MTLYYQKTHWHQIWLSLVQCSWLSVINKFSSETSQEFVWKCFKAKKSKTNPQLFGTVCQISFRSAIENFFTQKTCSIRPIHPQISGWVFKGTRTKYFNHSAISSTVKIAKIATYEISSMVPKRKWTRPPKKDSRFLGPVTIFYSNSVFVRNGLGFRL